MFVFDRISRSTETDSGYEIIQGQTVELRVTQQLDYNDNSYELYVQMTH